MLMINTWKITHFASKPEVFQQLFDKSFPISAFQYLISTNEWMKQNKTRTNNNYYNSRGFHVLKPWPHMKMFLSLEAAFRKAAFRQNVAPNNDKNEKLQHNYLQLTNSKKWLLCDNLSFITFLRKQIH